MEKLENNAEQEKKLNKKDLTWEEEIEAEERDPKYYNYLKKSIYNDLYLTLKEKIVDEEVMQMMTNHLMTQYFKDRLILYCLDFHSLYEIFDTSDLAIFIRLILNKEDPFVKFKGLIDRKVRTGDNLSRLSEDDLDRIHSIVRSHHYREDIAEYFGKQSEIREDNY